MGRFGQWVTQYVNLSKLGSAWRAKGKLYALRSVCIAVATNVSVYLGILLHALSNSYTVGILVATTSLPILIPCSIMIADRIWRRGTTNLTLPSARDFNWEKWFDEQEQEERLRIEGYGLNTEETERQLLGIFEYYQAARRLVRAHILKGLLPPQSADEAYQMLEETQKAAHDAKLLMAAINERSLKLDSKEFEEAVSEQLRLLMMPAATAGLDQTQQHQSS